MLSLFSCFILSDNQQFLSWVIFFRGSQKLGKPGIPGSNDLQAALRRLSLRRANELNEMDYRREERERLARERYVI